jgi:DNA-binding NarL/FixJ family response regulator
MRTNLSYREQEVILALVTHSESNIQIARNLCITLSCVHAHLANIRRKTGTSNRVQLMLWALREAKKGCQA